MKMKAAVLHSTPGKLSVDEMISMRLSLEEINNLQIKLDGIDFCVYYFHLSYGQNR